MRDDAVLDDHRITLGARDQASGWGIEIHANRFGKRALCVGQHRDACRCRACRFTPCFHHEWVVDGHADDFVHAFGGELILGAHKAWDVCGMASRRERARHCKDHDFAP